MTPVILTSGTQRRASLGMAAAVAVEGAILTGAGTLLAEVGEGTQRRNPTLFAAPTARRIEEALRREGLAVPRPPNGDAELVRTESLPDGARPPVGRA